MSGATFLILLLGAVEFIGVSYLTEKLYLKRIKGKQEKERSKLKTITVPKVLIYLVALYCIVTICLQILVVIDISSRYEAFTGISRALTVYKEHTSYSKEVALPGIITLMNCPVIACAFAFTQIFLNNLLVEEDKAKAIKKYKAYLLPAVLFIILYILQSNRGMIIDFFVGMLTIGIILWSVKGSWKKHVEIKTMVKIVTAGIIGLIIFYYSASVVGRINSKGLFDYITYYCGGSIECFNQYVKNEKQIKMVRGEETFYGLISNLDSFGITNYGLTERESGHLEFIYYEDEMVGNIYTAYRRWINDFGILGIVVFQGIMAAFFTIIYNKIKYSKDKYRNIWIIIYGYLAYTIYLHPMDGYLYLEVLSKAGIARLVAVILVYIVLENWWQIGEYLNSKLSKFKNEKPHNPEEKIKVLVFGITDNPGGVESVIMNYYRNIDREKVQFDFLCNTEIVAYEEEIKKLGGKIYRVTARSKDIKKYKEDMKNFFSNHAKEYACIWVNICSLANIDYLKYAKKYGIKRRIVHSHNSQNMDSFLRGMVHRLNKILLAEYATDFWACSEDAGKWFYYDLVREENKYKIINNAIDVEEYKYNPNIREEYRRKLRTRKQASYRKYRKANVPKKSNFLNRSI